MTNKRRLVAPFSAVFLIVVAALAFTQLQARSVYPPPILDPTFDLWVSDAAADGRRPLIWDLDYLKGPGDKIALSQTIVADRNALELRIFQDGVDERWIYVYLTQTIDGTRLRALFDREHGFKVGTWSYSQASCACGTPTSSRSTFFGVETNDGIHTLTFIFSKERAEAEEFLTHRTIFLQTVAGAWAYSEIDLAGEYLKAHWEPPERLTFSVILAAPGIAIGWHIGYLHRFVMIPTRTTSSAQSISSEPMNLIYGAADLSFTGSSGSPCYSRRIMLGPEILIK